MDQSFAVYLRNRMKDQSLSISKTANLAGISRQHLHKILNGDILQARMTTFIHLAAAIGEHPLHLFRAYLDASHLSFADISSRTPSFYVGDDIGFIGDITYPDNSLVKVNETFKKVWEIQNMGSTTWKKRKIVCLDDDTRTEFSHRDDKKTGLISEFREYELENVSPGKHTQIVIHFTAPSYPCTVISHWKMLDEDGNACFPENHPLSCCIKVISF